MHGTHMDKERCKKEKRLLVEICLHFGTRLNWNSSAKTVTHHDVSTGIDRGIHGIMVQKKNHANGESLRNLWLKEGVSPTVRESMNDHGDACKDGLILFAHDV